MADEHHGHQGPGARHPERWEEPASEPGASEEQRRSDARERRGPRDQDPAVHPVQGRTREELERWMDEYLPRAWMRRWGWPSWGELTRPMERLGPRVDVIDREEEVVVRAEIPGVQKEDLDITVVENAVTIRGTTRFEEREEKGEYYRAEMARGDFARTVGLPSSVDPDHCGAEFRDGILTLRMPKVSRGKRRRVEIR